MKTMILHEITRHIQHDATQSVLTKKILQACSYLYRAGSATHASLYNHGLLKRRHIDIPTISVGNLTMGGTGKTPIVQHLAHLILQYGGTPLVLSRGYGQDEQYQLQARLCPKGGVLACGPDRHRAATTKLLEMKETSSHQSYPTMALLDDGLQHWSLERDADIVVINAYDPWGGNNQIVPAGLLRETPQEGLQRADLVVLHNVSSAISTPHLTDIRQRIKDLTQKGVPVVETQVVPSGVYRHEKKDGAKQGLLVAQDGALLTNANVMAISGIGCPKGFVDVLQHQLGVGSVDSVEYIDHHAYTTTDVDYLHRRLMENNQKHEGRGQEVIPIITEKDYYRCLFGSASSSSFIDTLQPMVVTTDIRVVNMDSVNEDDLFKDLLQVAVARRNERCNLASASSASSSSSSSTAASSVASGWMASLASLGSLARIAPRPPVQASLGSNTKRTMSTSATPTPAFHHVPVLPIETKTHWSPPSKYFNDNSPPCLMVDVTVGGGTHSETMLASTPDNVHLLCIDRDIHALNACKKRFNQHPTYKHRVMYMHAPFSELDNILNQSFCGEEEDMSKLQHILALTNGQVAGVLADLGVSSVQLDTPERGFSFQRDGPLDMRMNPNQEQQQTTTAADLVNNMSEMSLVQLFQNYGDVSIKESKRVARLICQKRPLHTTLELVQAILGEKNKGKHFKKSPATKFFQALRIAVNNELDELDSLLQTVPKVLCDGGAFVVISFHSLEDRRVKVCFKELSKCRTGNYELITKKAKVAQKEETGVNPRSRSSRLRVLKKKVRRERRARKVVVVDVKVKKGATGKKGSIQ